MTILEPLSHYLSGIPCTKIVFTSGSGLRCMEGTGEDRAKWKEITCPTSTDSTKADVCTTDYMSELTSYEERSGHVANSLSFRYGTDSRLRQGGLRQHHVQLPPGEGKVRMQDRPLQRFGQNQCQQRGSCPDSAGRLRSDEIHCIGEESLFEYFESAHLQLTYSLNRKYEEELSDTIILYFALTYYGIQS